MLELLEFLFEGGDVLAGLAGCVGLGILLLGGVAVLDFVQGEFLEFGFEVVDLL